MASADLQFQVYAKAAIAAGITAAGSSPLFVFTWVWAEGPVI